MNKIILFTFLVLLINAPLLAADKVVWTNNFKDIKVTSGGLVYNAGHLSQVYDAYQLTRSRKTYRGTALTPPLHQQVSIFLKTMHYGIRCCGEKDD